jgi:hypothetical protein
MPKIVHTDHKIMYACSSFIPGCYALDKGVQAKIGSSRHHTAAHGLVGVYSHGLAPKEGFSYGKKYEHRISFTVWDESIMIHTNYTLVCIIMISGP